MSDDLVAQYPDWTIREWQHLAILNKESIQRIQSELEQANARERDAYFAGYENGYVELAADYDVEESWQQYNSGDSK